jgi:putative NADPH-quinone reductase
VRILAIFCHPAQDSFAASVLEALTRRLRGDGHELTLVDLYAEGFDPVLDLAGWRAHRQDRRHDGGLDAHIAALAEAEGLILVYPTWWYGLPAMLKGWIDRVWQPGVAFRMEGGAFRTHCLTRLTRFAVVTTYGSPRGFIEWVVGDPARRQLMRGLALQFAPGVRACWAPIYSVDQKSAAELERARDGVVSRAARLFRGGATRRPSSVRSGLGAHRRPGAGSGR